MVDTLRPFKFRVREYYVDGANCARRLALFLSSVGARVTSMDRYMACVVSKLSATLEYIRKMLAPPSERSQREFGDWSRGIPKWKTWWDAKTRCLSCQASCQQSVVSL
ncbi:hypothetical protein NDU88_004499 [Pleurodeles waltl]|uniref:Uncharacterized protein n=1 Tax=Pleurodeles waltl TaxID=8319 RepID=A0AAV7SIY3_PLEWA|nr:hypothetical protein NDU88_004499 [Pleurodeles waltl]